MKGYGSPACEQLYHIHKRTLTVVAISALLGRLQIGSKPVRDERYPACRSADPKQQV
jgi:hypothetical protein